MAHPLASSAHFLQTYAGTHPIREENRRMAENVGNADARPDLDLEEDEGVIDGTVSEQELADIEAPCAGVGVGIPHAKQRHGGARSTGFRPGGGPAALAYEERTGIKAPRIIAWEILSLIHISEPTRLGM